MKKIINCFKVLALIILLMLVSITSVNASPPQNFQTTQIIGSGLEGPSGFEIAPDGRIFLLERTGTVKVYKNGQLLSQPFAELPSLATGDRGLIGIAFDPEFNTNHYVYFYYTGMDQLNRLVRFNASGDVGTDGPVILYETKEPSNLLHVGGSIQFGADGKLYFAVGDNGYPPNAQNLGNAHGKILRINKDGTIPADNPFVNQAGKLPEIWAYGMRNPWRFQFDSETGKLYGGDVGDFSIEEVNHIVKGGNYGWPICEGVCQNPNLINPIYHYPHFDDSAAVTGGPVYRNVLFPESYIGKLFFADYAQGFIKTLTLDQNGNSLGVSDFDLSAGSVVDLKIAPDGSMYYITYYPGRLYRISYSTDNHIPVANAGSDKTKGADPLTVNFTSNGTTDPDSDVLTYHWDFGDGTNSQDPNPTKEYTGKGTYTVQLTVSDGVNSAQAIPLVIQVGMPPELIVASPLEGTKYKAGDTISYTAFASDGAGFDIDDGSIVTDIVFHHDTHIHPYLNGMRGRAGQFLIANQDHEPSANTWYEVKVTATDSSGLSTTKSINIYPEKSTITLMTIVDGLKIFLNGVPHFSGYIFEGVVNYVREISTEFIQEVNGVVYQFSHWYNNGPISQLIPTPEEDTTVTAYFEEATQFNAEYFNNDDLVGAPILTRVDQGINFNWEEGSPDTQILNDNFSVRWSGSQHFSAGRYEFTTMTDDGVRLYIDGVLVIDKWIGQNGDNKSVLDLTSGNHLIVMEYFEHTGLSSAKLKWSRTIDQPTLPGFSGEYFNNKDATGEAVVTREDQQINFDWQSTSPNPSILNDQFSSRWTKTDNFSEGIYEFNITADDGVRLYIDDQLILNRWVAQNTSFKIKKFLAAGDHIIKLEYFENFGGAKVQMNYLKVGSTNTPVPPTDYQAKYWNVTELATIPTIPTIEPTLTKSESAVNFDWQSTSPDPLINVDNFIAVWEKNQVFETKKYKFNTISDDGVRVFIDDELILDQWNDHAQTTFSVEKEMTAGTHKVRVEYYERAGNATAIFDIEKLNTPIAGFNVEFFNNKDLSGTPEVTRIDSDINYEWQSQSPDPLINLDQFSARWVRVINFTEGNYQFNFISDDGVRLYIDDQLVLDKWILQSGDTHQVTKHLTAGNHTIRIEYFENYGLATMKFNYQQIVEPVIPFSAEYFNNKDLTGPAALTRNDDNINFTWQTLSPDPAIQPNQFSVRWTKQQQFAAGSYTFSLKSDDGVRFYIDDQLIINDWSDHALTEFTQTVDLTEGLHTLRIEYYDNYDAATIIFKQL